jgi:hypothetical protein
VPRSSVVNMFHTLATSPLLHVPTGFAWTVQTGGQQVVIRVGAQIRSCFHCVRHRHHPRAFTVVVVVVGGVVRLVGVLKLTQLTPNKHLLRQVYQTSGNNSISFTS